MRRSVNRRLRLSTETLSNLALGEVTGGFNLPTANPADSLCYSKSVCPTHCLGCTATCVVTGTCCVR